MKLSLFGKLGLFFHKMKEKMSRKNVRLKKEFKTLRTENVSKLVNILMYSICRI